MVDRTTTRIVLGTDSRMLLSRYLSKPPTVQAVVRFSRENEENRPNGLTRTSWDVFSVVERTRTSGNRVTRASAASTRWRPTPARPGAYAFLVRVMLPSAPAPAGSAAGRARWR